MLVFVFSGFAMKAVGVCASEVVVEVRRQFNERPGIMDGSQRPDYTKCVSIVAAAALKEMRRPGLLALLFPIAVGMAFKHAGALQGNALLGPMVMAGMLMTATITGILLSPDFAAGRPIRIGAQSCDPLASPVLERRAASGDAASTSVS